MKVDAKEVAVTFKWGVRKEKTYGGGFRTHEVRPRPARIELSPADRARRMDRWLERALLAALLGYGVAVLALGPYAVAIDLPGLARAPCARLVSRGGPPVSRAGGGGGGSAASSIPSLAAWAIGPPLPTWSPRSGSPRSASCPDRPTCASRWIGFVAEAVFLARTALRVWRWTARAVASPVVMGRPFDVPANSQFFGALLEPPPEVTTVKRHHRRRVREPPCRRRPSCRWSRLASSSSASARNGGMRSSRFSPIATANFWICLSPFRRLFAPPVQTNWRIHVTGSTHEAPRHLFSRTRS